ncbi:MULTISPECIES: hypothetical protein [unclassified Pseudomonas]|uniref:hypothetical protein n=1 Tax=Pseudomonas TaxID=286 RepID=UPI0024B34D24|nr:MULTISPECIES: hypothetical protein [unclassified Pseudomonas]
MAFTDDSFKNVSPGDSIYFHDTDGARRGTFQSASNGKLSIYWAAYSRDASFEYWTIKDIEVNGKKLGVDGSLTEKPQPWQPWQPSQYQ